MSNEKISPVADNVIRKCGGPRAVARLVGMSYSQVFKWRHLKSKGGTGGLVPAGAQEKLMQLAVAGQVSLTPGDFFDIPEQSVASPQADR